MVAPPLDLTTFDYHDKAQLTAMRQWANWSYGQLAQRMTEAGRPISDSALTAWGRKLGVPNAKDAAAGQIEVVASPPLDPEEEVERDRTVMRLRTDLRDLQRKYDAACKESNLYQDIHSIAHDVFSQTEPTKVLPPKIGTGATEEDAILGWADWHGFEVVDYDVMQGYNAYNPVIMCRRAQYTVDHTLDILYGCHQGTTFDRLYVFDLGDGINGDHLEEQLATNAKPVFEAMRGVAIIKAQALTELSSHIPVVYICVPGNHGRRGKKMQWKLPTETADWLMGEMIADRVRGNERIECIVPKAWTAGITVRGQNHVLNHGFSAAKGGYGGISWYSFQRADGQKTAVEAAHGKRVHHRWYGHIHQQAEIPMMDGEGEQHIIGSLKGGDEYALEALNRYSAPSQKIVGCHDTYGVTWRYPLNVQHADDKPSRYEEIVA